MTLTREVGPVHIRGTERWPGQNPPPPFHIESSTDTGKIVLRRPDGQKITHQIYHYRTLVIELRFLQPYVTFYLN